MKRLMQLLSVSLVLVSMMMTQVSYAQVIEKEKTKKEIKKEKKQLKKAMKALQRKVLKDPELLEKYTEIINTCPEYDLSCQEQLQNIVEDTLEGSNLQKNASGLTFGICHPNEKSQNLHRLVYSKRTYDCKLSSQGDVYNKTVERKLYGPGIWWEKQSYVIMCTGPAYGKVMHGMSTGVGLGMGFTATSMFGKIGLCLSVGGGKSVGFFVGGEKYTFGE